MGILFTPIFEIPKFHKNSTTVSLMLDDLWTLNNLYLKIKIIHQGSSKVFSWEYHEKELLLYKMLHK